MRAIYVMWLRQLKRYWRSRGRMIGSLGQPILFLVALGFGLGPIYAKAGAGDFIQFLAPGIISMTILFNSMFSGIEVIWDRQFGFLKETLVAPVSRLEIMIGKTLGGATISILQGILVFIVTLIVGFNPNFTYFPLAILFMFLIAILFTAFGVAIASNLEDMQAFPIIMNFLIMPLFFLSGSIFPLEEIPRTLKLITMFNPLTYGVDGIRGSLTGLYHFNPYTDFFVITLLAGIMLAIGTYMFNKVEI